MALQIRVGSRRILLDQALVIWIFCAASLALGYGVFYVFKNEVNFRASGQQADYVLDGYYYLKLGADALQVARGADMGLYDASVSVQPNQSSGGIVFLSALILSAVGSEWLVPLVLLALILFACVFAYKSRMFGPGIFFIPIGGLFPYMPIPSKELFVLAGLILFAVGFLSSGRSVFLILLGLFVLYFARTEALLIFCASGVLWFFRGNKIILSVICAAAAVGYLLVREYLVGASSLMQYQAARVDLLFCSVGPINVCVGDGGGVELVYMVRLLTLLVLPLKWIFDFILIFVDGTLGLTDWVIRFFSVVQLVVLYFAWKWSASSVRMSRDGGFLRGWILLFAALYWIIYASVFYFQPSRQALLCLAFVVMALSISAHNSRTVEASGEYR